MTCKNFANRFIAMFLCIVMIVGMIPASVSAAEPADPSTTIRIEPADMGTGTYIPSGENFDSVSYVAATADKPAHIKIVSKNPINSDSEVHLNINKVIAGKPIMKFFFGDNGYLADGKAFGFNTNYTNPSDCWGVTGADLVAPSVIDAENNLKQWTRTYAVGVAADKTYPWADIQNNVLKALKIKRMFNTNQGYITPPYEFYLYGVEFFATEQEAAAANMLVSVKFVNSENADVAAENKLAGVLFSEPADNAAIAALKTGDADNENFFVGWQLADGTVVDETYKVTEDITVHPKYDVGNKIEFMVDGETYATKYVSTFDTVLAAEDYPANPVSTVPGSSFAGWSTTVDGAVDVKAGETEYTETETTLYAQFRESVEVTYKLPEGNEITYHAKSASLVHHEFDAAPEKDGMVFMGWALEEDPTVIVEDGAFVVEEAVTFVPVFAYKVTFNITSPADEEQEELITNYFLEGAELVFPEDPEKDGAYEFVCWLDKNGEEAVAGVVEASADYTAKFELSADPITVIYMATAEDGYAFRTIEVPGNEVLLAENASGQYILNPALENEFANDINAGPYNTMLFTNWTYTDGGNFIIDENEVIESALSTKELVLNVKDLDKPVVVVPVFSETSETPTDPEDAGYKAPVYYTTFVIGDQTIALETAPDGTIANLAALEAMARADEDQLFLNFVDEAGRKVDENTTVTANMLITPKYAPIIINSAKKSLGSIVSLIGVMKKIKEHNGQPTTATGARPYRLYDGDELINCAASSHYEVLFEDGYVRFKLIEDTTMAEGTIITLRIPANELIKIKKAPIIVFGYRSNADLPTFAGDMCFYDDNLAMSRGWGGAISPSVFNNSEKWATAIVNLDGRKFTGGDGAIFTGKKADEYNAAYPEAYHCGTNLRIAPNFTFAPKDKYLDIQYIALFETLEQAGTFTYQPGILDRAEYEAKKEAEREAARKAAEEATKAEAEAAVEEVVEVTEDAKENEAEVTEETETTEAAE